MWSNEACLAVLAAFLVAILLSVVLYRLLRPLFSVTVACWFCHEKSVVPYENRNCWDCLLCDQYNGFQDDGDYNKSIPAQHVEELNHPVSAGDQKHKYWPTTNGLCEACNRNQQLKICQLANFVPNDEAKFDAEIVSFTRRMESIYKLCNCCAAHVDSTLHQQDAILSGRLLNERLWKTASEHSNSSSRRLVKSSEQWHFQSSLQSSLCSALGCLSAVCAALIVIVGGSRLLPDSLATRLLAMVPQSSFWLTAGRSLVPFTHEERMVLFTLIGTLARLTAILVHGFKRPRFLDVLSCLLWCVLLAVALSPDWLSKDVVRLSQITCALLAAATSIVLPDRRLRPKGLHRSKAGRPGSASPSLSSSGSMVSGADDYLSSRASDCASAHVGHAGHKGSIGSLPQYASACRSTDVQSSFSSLRLDAHAPSSLTSHHQSHMSRCDSSSSLCSPRSTCLSGRTHLPTNKGGSYTDAVMLERQPLIRPARLSVVPQCLQGAPSTGSLAHTPDGGDFLDINHFRSASYVPKGPSSTRTSSCYAKDKASLYSRSFASEYGGESCCSGSYYTAGLPHSIADRIQHQSCPTGSRHEGKRTASSYDDNPFFAKFLIGISAGLNIAVVAVVLHRCIY